MAATVRLVAILVALALLVTSWRAALPGRVGPSEERVFRLVNNGSDAIHVPVWLVMQAGSFWAIWATGGVLWLNDRRAAAVVAVVVGTGVWGGVKLVKPFVGRGRPDAHLVGVGIRGVVQTGLGYPSGHAAIALTLALVATEGADPVTQLLAMLVAATTGVARIYVGAHLPLDVVGGFAIGAAVGSSAALGLAA